MFSIEDSISKMSDLDVGRVVVERIFSGNVRRSLSVPARATDASDVVFMKRHRRD